MIDKLNNKGDVGAPWATPRFRWMVPVFWFLILIDVELFVISSCNSFFRWTLRELEFMTFIKWSCPTESNAFEREREKHANGVYFFLSCWSVFLNRRIISGIKNEKKEWGEKENQTNRWEERETYTHTHTLHTAAKKKNRKKIELIGKWLCHPHITYLCVFYNNNKINEIINTWQQQQRR